VSLELTQNSEARLVCPTNILMANITFLKNGQPFERRPVGKVGQSVCVDLTVVIVTLVIF